jgi:phosphoribosyl 1,2-cyclic phosphate phosphodiesterase
MVELTFLGTGTSQGVPVIGCRCEVCTSSDPRDNRLRTSAMIRVDGQTYVFDTGPDFRQQMLREDPDNVDAVIFTHEHKDHIAGLDDIRAFNFRTGNALDIYATEAVQTALKREYHYVFTDFKYPGVPEVNLHTIDPGHPFSVNGTLFIPIQVLHYKMPVLGFRVEKLAYITDANFISDEEMEKLKGLDILVLNALRRKKHISHFNLEEALEIVDILKPKRAYFTHISHLLGLHKEIQNELPPNIYLAYDGLKVSTED